MLRARQLRPAPHFSWHQHTTKFAAFLNIFVITFVIYSQSFGGKGSYGRQSSGHTSQALASDCRTSFSRIRLQKDDRSASGTQSGSGRTRGRRTGRSESDEKACIAVLDQSASFGRSKCPSKVSLPASCPLR